MRWVAWQNKCRWRRSPLVLAYSPPSGCPGFRISRPKSWSFSALFETATIILFVESFTSQLDRRFLGYAALFGLAMIFIATFFVAPQSSTASAPLWTFYSADALSLFFKRIALASTAGVLVMMLDFAPSVSIGVQGATRQAGLGEFFTIPLFTCAGLMWMASAIDFVLIFLSLEWVSISL